MNIAINGLGRIGKSIVRALYHRQIPPKKLNLVAINIGPASVEQLLTTMRYDSIMGPLLNTPLSFADGILTLGSLKIRILQETAPEKLPWDELAIDWVVECSGFFTEREQAKKHQIAGAKNVLISAPAKNPDSTIIPGVNDQDYKKEHTIVSLGSCTTNAIAPLLKLLLQLTELESVHLLTTHAYTNSQNLVDAIPNSTKDVRRFRAAGMNIIPGSTGAGQLMGEIFPLLAGKTSAIALRVPVANVSLIEIVYASKKNLSATTINNYYQNTAQNLLKGILATTNDPVVSSDFIGNPHSVVVDTLLTETIGTHGRIFGWYDNEWGYSNRVLDFLMHIAQ